jgi:hypothetical protein
VSGHIGLKTSEVKAENLTAKSAATHVVGLEDEFLLGDAAMAGNLAERVKTKLRAHGCKYVARSETDRHELWERFDGGLKFSVRDEITSIGAANATLRAGGVPQSEWLTPLPVPPA